VTPAPPRRPRGSILNPEVEHDEVLAAMGLRGEPIRHRHFYERFINLSRVQPGELLFDAPRTQPKDAPPYNAPPFPPPGLRCD
jgi:hypothetical protein